MNVRNSILMVLFSGVFLVVGIAVLLWGVFDSRTAIESQQWPSVPGSVTVSQVNVSTDSQGDTLYGSQIAYRYIVSDQGFTGSEVSFGDYSSSDSQHAEEITARYPAGRAVTVFYNPQNPAQAVLEPGFSGWLFLPLGLGSVFTLVGGGMLAGVILGIRRGMF